MLVLYLYAIVVFYYRSGMLLEDRVAVVYGAGGAVGGAVARGFAAEGAIVALAGRTAEPLEAVAADLPGAEVAVVDARDRQAVADHLRSVVQRHGRINVSFNLISADHIQGIPLVNMSPDDFSRGLEERVRSHFVTATAAARHMIDQASGTILMLTATPDRAAIPNAGSFGAQNAALESFARALAIEIGPRGVRVACIRSAGSPDAAGVDQVFSMHADNAGLTRDDFDADKAASTLLGRLPLLADIAHVAAFLASDRARAMTGTIANVTCGELLD